MTLTKTGQPPSDDHLDKYGTVPRFDKHEHSKLQVYMCTAYCPRCGKEMWSAEEVKSTSCE